MAIVTCTRCKNAKPGLERAPIPGATGQTGLTKMLTAPADGYSMSVFIGDTFALQAAPTKQDSVLTANNLTADQLTAAQETMARVRSAVKLDYR